MFSLWPFGAQTGRRVDVACFPCGDARLKKRIEVTMDAENQSGEDVKAKLEPKWRLVKTTTMMMMVVMIIMMM